jgi:phage FluMu gp28-like protein
VCLDYAGPGIGLGDYLVKEHGEYDPDRHMFGKIELVKGTNENKVSNFSKLRMVFERRGTRIPISNVIREDLHSVFRCSTPTGQVTYRAPHNEDGHADRATAKALAERARSYSGQAGRFYVFDKTRRSLASFGRQTREVVG